MLFTPDTGKTSTPRAAALTPHELRVLGLLADGHKIKTAASALGVTPHTIAFHLRNIYGKLDVHSKSEAVAVALRSRMVQ
ncbi:MAG: response regulator transcription factor [Blastocatellia bacterium]